MNLHWHSLAEFLAMGQHGPYVWGSFLVMAALMIVEPLLVRRRRRQLLARLRRQQRPFAAAGASGPGQRGEAA